MWSTALSALSGSVRSLIGALIGAVPGWLWQYLLAAIVGAAIGGMGVHRYHTGGVAQVVQPHITSEERGPPEKIPARVWKGLAIGQTKAASEVDTTQIVVPQWFFENKERGNGLPEVTYSRELLGTGMSLPELNFVTVGLKGGRRPAVEVTPGRVRLFANSPETGRPLTYTYQVPSPDWTLSVAGTFGVAPETISSSSSLVVERALGDWTAGASVGYSVTAGQTISRGWQAGVTIERSLFQWSF